MQEISLKAAASLRDLAIICLEKSHLSNRKFDCFILRKHIKARLHNAWTTLIFVNLDVFWAPQKVLETPSRFYNNPLFIAVLDNSVKNCRENLTNVQKAMSGQIKGFVE